MKGQSNLTERIYASARLARIRSTKLAMILTRRDWRQGLRNGVAASVEHSKVPFRDDIATVIDVGASRGQFALFAASRFPQAKIISFEPLSEPLADLRRVLGSRVEIHQTAIGAAADTVEMNVSRSDDSSSILTIGEEQQRIFPGTDAIDTVEVPVSTLDETIDQPPARPCLLKVDVQGLELEVLKGGAETLKSVDEALIECSFMELYEGQALADEVIAHMLGLGLRLAGVYGMAKTADGQAIQADLFFRRAADS